MFEAQTEIKNTIIASTAEVLSEKKAEDREKHTSSGLLPKQRGEQEYSLEMTRKKVLILFYCNARHAKISLVGNNLDISQIFH